MKKQVPRKPRPKLKLKSFAKGGMVVCAKGGAVRGSGAGRKHAPVKVF